MPWMIIEERLDGSPFTRRASGESVGLSTEPLTADQRRIQHLEAEIERLRSRRSLRLANTVGGMLHGVRRRVGASRTAR
jgi:hypothetical protein